MQDFSVQSINSFLRATGATRLWNFLFANQGHDDGGLGVAPEESTLHPQDVSQASIPALQFREDQPRVHANRSSSSSENISFHDEVTKYCASTLEWTCAFKDAWWGNEMLSVQDLKLKIQLASAQTTSILYAHHDAKRRAKSTSISFRCEHGRDRQDGGSKSKLKGIQKPLSSVDAASSGKRFRPDKRPAPAHTNMRRGKFCNCPYRFVLSTKDITQTSSENTKGIWFMSEHGKAEMCDVHMGHPKHAFAVGRIKGPMLKKVTDMAATGCDTQSIIARCLAEDSVELSRHQVDWAVRKSREHTAMTEFQEKSGGVVDFLKYLKSVPTVSYLMLAQNAQTNALMSCNEHGVLMHTSFSTTDERAGVDDVKRLVTIGGEAYFVHAVAWVDEADVKMFEQYPEVLVVDTMHKANVSHNLLNVVSIDGALLNNALMRAYIPCGTKAMYRWVLGTALPSLVPKAALQKTQVVMSDSDTVMTPVIDALCTQVPVLRCFETCVVTLLQGDILPNAITLRCVWHMVEKNLYDRSCDK